MNDALEVIKQVALVVGALAPVVVPLLIRWGMVKSAESKLMAEELETTAQKVVAVAKSLQNARQSTPENLGDAVEFALKDGIRAKAESMGAVVAKSLQSTAETVDAKKTTPSKGKKFARFLGTLVMRRLGV